MMPDAHTGSLAFFLSLSWLSLWGQAVHPIENSMQFEQCYAKTTQPPSIAVSLAVHLTKRNNSVRLLQSR